jgi:hypothetical protein
LKALCFDFDAAPAKLSTMVNHAACLKRLFGSEGQLALLPWRELPMLGEIGFRIGVIGLGTIPVVLVIAAVFWR